MKIVFLMQDTGVIYGLERATLDLLAGLDQSGCSPHVLLIGETRMRLARSSLRRALRDQNISHEILNVNARFSPRLIRDIRTCLAAQGADVLHTLGYKANLHGGFATRWGRFLPIVSTVHGWLYLPDYRERFYAWLDRRILCRFRKVIVLSRFYERTLLAAGVSRDRLALIPSGLDVSGFRVTPPPESGLTVGMLGRLSFEKNHPMFLRAASAACKQGVPACYLVAGDGPDRPGIEDQIRDLGLADSVILAGYLSRDDFFGQAHIVVMTSRIENLPYTVLEAMAWGRPVIATRVGGLPDLIEDGRTGILVEPDDHHGLADAIRRVAQDPDLRTRLAENAREKLAAEFGYDLMIARHVALYNSLAQAREESTYGSVAGQRSA
jgi:glycosyltransferase involved in cell wall biosynthesis